MNNTKLYKNRLKYVERCKKKKKTESINLLIISLMN